MFRFLSLKHVCSFVLACQDKGTEIYLKDVFQEDEIISFCFKGSTYGPTKIAKPTVFQVVLRGIGKSFQSAITAPRMHHNGYGNATAQS